MATRAALRLLRSLHRAVKQQQQVVEQQEESVKFLLEANETEQLEASRDILSDLNAQLHWAIDSWRELALGEEGLEHLPWSPSPSTPLPQPPFQEQQPSPVSENRRAASLSDPAVGTEARYTQQWDDWVHAPTIPGLSTIELPQTTPWWMQERDHYGLCHPHEQGQIESVARAAQLNRAYYAEPYVGHYQPVAQEPTNPWYQQCQPPALPLPPVPERSLTHFRPARANSNDFWLDKEFDPFFWQKNLRPGNIWTNPPRYPVPEEENMSPRTIPSYLYRCCRYSGIVFLAEFSTETGAPARAHEEPGLNSNMLSVSSPLSYGLSMGAVPGR
ncbi:hypothetical protein C8A03DRAFT_44816 [Achaetomium macrosporum]|uniref:Uncharacterized protein n=1 Tax=Achaetomium macrosporum TaxID=79813 RepID=A0AAN7HEQ1_9PEZI|nr:hypothetical protein C8A03DRAFT_44816 [Achaetomium macrosporum]